MKRVTVLYHNYWVKTGCGGNFKHEYDTLYGFSDKAIEEELERRNKRYRTNFWKVIADFNLKRMKDQREYIKHCIDAYYDPHSLDHESSHMGAMFAEHLEEYLAERFAECPPEKKRGK